MSMAKGEPGLTADQPLIGAGHWRVASAEEHQSNGGFFLKAV